MADAIRRLDAGDIDGAVEAVGSGWQAAGDLEAKARGRAAEAKAAGDVGRAVRLYRAYFDGFPLGRTDWDGLRRGWNEAAGEYLEARQAARAAGARDDSLDDDLAARKTYDELTALFDNNGEPADQARLADRLVAEHARSLFTAAGILTALAAVRPDEAPGPVDYGRNALVGMDRAGVPARQRVVARILLVSAYQRQASDALYEAVQAAAMRPDGIGANGEPVPAPDDEAAAVAEPVTFCKDLAKAAAAFRHERRWAALAAAGLLSRGRSDALLAQARREYRAFLAAYPGAPEAGRARTAVVGTYCAAGQPDFALQALRDLERDSPAAEDWSGALFDISRAYFGQKKFAPSLAALKEIEDRYPHTRTASMAALGAGEVYDKLGDEANMVAAYRRAAARPPVYTFANAMDASDTRNRAVQALGEYYMRKELWDEALLCWIDWLPRSWCGTCQSGMLNGRAQAIAECVRRLGAAGLKDAALIDRMQARVLSPDEWATELAVWVVDARRAAGRLAEFEARAKAAVAAADAALAAGLAPRADAARRALEYAELTHMADRRDAAGLLEQFENGCGTPGPRPTPLAWKPPHLLRLLDSVPAEAAAAARERAAEPGVGGNWACLVLARLKDERTVALVQARVRPGLSPSEVEPELYPLTVLGTDAAYAALWKFASGPDRTIADTALSLYHRRTSPATKPVGDGGPMP